ncbi:HAD family hydrolase [Legionella sp. D16C41]|uniref:HAD family hydrolase n=1 Tax=Legionella sp. D16C41 TaxID=3402688 RepID=UPI003AF761D2
MERHKITTLCFDLDGTLVEMHRIFSFPLLAMTLYRFFPEISMIRFQGIFHQAVQKLLNNTTSLTNFDVFINHLVDCSRSKNKATIERLVRQIFSKDFPRLKHFFYPIPQNKEILLWAKKNNYRLILATNPVFPISAIKTRLEAGGLDLNYFNGVTHAENMTRTKPRVEYYQELVSKFQLQPHECLMIGNDPIKDLPAACVGMNTFLLSTAKNQHVIANLNDSRLTARGNYQALIHYLQNKASFT